MSKLYITEYSNAFTQQGQALPIGLAPALAQQVIDIGDKAVMSEPLTPATRLVTVIAEIPCLLDGRYLPANLERLIAAPANHQFAVSAMVDQPSRDPFSDAIALLRIALDPKAVQAELSRLEQMTKSAEATKAELLKHDMVLNDTLRVLTEKQAAVDQSSAQLQAAQNELAGRLLAHEQQVAALALNRSAHMEIVAAFEKHRQEIETDLTRRQAIVARDIEQRTRAMAKRETDVAYRERAAETKNAELAARELGYQQKMSRLKEITN